MLGDKLTLSLNQNYFFFFKFSPDVGEKIKVEPNALFTPKPDSPITFFNEIVKELSKLKHLPVRLKLYMPGFGILTFIIAMALSIL